MVGSVGSRRSGNAAPGVAAGILLTAGAVAAASGTDERHVRLGPLTLDTTCPLRHLTGRRCPGCGMTRAVALALRGRPLRATRTHPGAIPMLIALSIQLGRALRPNRASLGAA